MCVEAVVTGSTWRGGEVCSALDHLSPSLTGWGARGRAQRDKGSCFVLPPRSCLVGMETALPNSVTVDSSRRGRPVRPLAPGSFRVGICDAGGPSASCLYGTPRKEEAWEGTARGWAGLFQG